MDNQNNLLRDPGALLHFLPIVNERNIAGRLMKKSALLFLLLFYQTSGATVSEHLDYEYYTAYAHPDRSLANVIREASPIRENGRTFEGYTHWNVKWHFWWHESGDGRCSMSSVNTDVTAVISLPCIVHATAKQEEQFNRYVAALRVHELGHYENGKQAATEIEREILALPEMANCETLAAAANDVGRRILKEYNNKDVQYDAATGHGRTQGATLPD